MWIVDIDVGGTLTDGIFTQNEKLVCVKVDTTPHDLTVCLLDCLTQGSAKLGFSDLREFLDNVELIRWSTTITSNVLAELRGPRVGLLVSKGHERDLYGKEPRGTAAARLLREGDVIGVDGSGSAIEIMSAARFLLESGVRRICVSLKGSHRDSGPETSIKCTIEQQYPDHFLGSVPVLTGSDMSKAVDDETRTYCTLINAYTHGALAATLFKAEDELRETAQYAGSFLVSHINGGVAGIAKTKAIDTIESGPILGIQGSAYLAKEYGLGDLVAMDVGGTTAKISVLRGAGPIYRRPSDLFGTPLDISLPYLRSIALGGGSVVKVTNEAKSSRIQLGPESMGSYPGPACYGLGGDHPTLTDAFVATGLINPDYFLGGAKPIDRDLAWKTIEESVARPLGLPVEEASETIIRRAFELVANVIVEAAADLRQDFSKHVLFAYGGNGGLFACGVAEKAGLDRVQLFSLGPVFSAFGSSVSDVCHVYERALARAAISESELKRIKGLVEEMKAEGVKDLLGEGMCPGEISYNIELEALRPGEPPVPVTLSESSLENAQALQSAFDATLGNGGRASTRDLMLELVRVRVRKAIPKPRLVALPLQSADPSDACLGTRPVFWGRRNFEARAYRWEALQPGNRIQGAAVLEAANSSYFIPDGWALAVDRFGNATVSRSA